MQTFWNALQNTICILSGAFKWFWEAWDFSHGMICIWAVITHVIFEQLLKKAEHDFATFFIHYIWGKIKKKSLIFEGRVSLPSIFPFFLPPLLPSFLPSFCLSLLLSLISFAFFILNIFFKVSFSNSISNHELLLSVVLDWGPLFRCGLRREEGFLITCLWRPPYDQ